MVWWNGVPQLLSVRRLIELLAFGIKSTKNLSWKADMAKVADPPLKKLIKIIKCIISFNK